MKRLNGDGGEGVIVRAKTQVRSSSDLEMHDETRERPSIRTKPDETTISDQILPRHS